MDQGVVSVLMAGAIGAGIAAVYRFLELGQAPALDRAWSEAAGRLGGRALIEPATFWKRAIRRIRLDVERVGLSVDTFSEGAGQNRHQYTRLRAGPLPGLSRVEMSVEPRTILTAITRRLALGESPVGDQAFDAAFRVTSHPAGLARELLDGLTRSLAMASQEGFEIEGKTLTITFRGLPEDAAPLVAIGRYGRALVERWVELAQAPSAAAEALGLVPAEPGVELANEGATTVASGVRRGHELSLAVQSEGPRYTMVVSVGVTGGAPFTLDRKKGQAATNEGAVPAYARALAEGAPPSLRRIVGEPGRLKLEFEGLMHKPDELERYIEAVLEATRSGSAYR